LLDRWSEAYSIILDPAPSLGEFSTNDLSWWRQSERELRQLGIQVGGEAAASLLDSHLRPAPQDPSGRGKATSTSGSACSRALAA
jgi:hypothetical protein